MASIYSNAELVLAAASASSVNEGFLGQKSLAIESAVEIPRLSDNSKSLSLKYRIGRQLHRENDLFIDPLNGDPLDTRGWALQRGCWPDDIWHLGVASYTGL